MKWILSHGAAAEMERRALAESPQMPGDPHGILPRTYFGVPIQTSAMFPFPARCSSCAGSGDGGPLSTWCIACAGVGQVLIDGMMRDDHANQTMLITRRMPADRPKAFAISFPANVSVPAAPMRGRIKEVRLP